MALLITLIDAFGKSGIFAVLMDVIGLIVMAPKVY
jgi:hypothetical protein